MNNDDTIAAISTPPGKGGIGIVRISGDQAIELADRIFRASGGTKLSGSPSHRIHYGHIIDPSSNETVDEVLVSVMKAPRTYTREDTVEINCHGGPVPLRRVLELVINHGARLAEPGEFTRRAFLNGRLDLSQAEAVADLINAMTEQARKSAMDQLRGSLSSKIAELRDEIIDLTAYVEAHIDFPEDDIGTGDMADMKRRAQKITGQLRELVDGAREGIILREGVKTAIIGSPNVGKSSLLNILVQQDRAIVTEMPGTTRDIIEEFINIKGIPIRIMDTAGIREVDDRAELEGVRRSLAAMQEAALVLFVLDGSRHMTESEMAMLDDIDPQKTIIVVNKSDLKRVLSLKADGIPHAEVSAKTGAGISDLKEKIARCVLHGTVECPSALVTNVRHVQAIELALDAMNRFGTAFEGGTPPEFLAVELRDALQALGEIVGITTPDEILDRIFSSFCIGK
jgi:tRNA modification GTPase